MNCLYGILRLCAEIRQAVSQWTGARRTNPEVPLALLQAARSGDERVVRELLERGVPADGARTRRQETALFLAAENGHAAAVKALLEYGADPSVPNEDGAGAITQAAAAGSVDLIKLMRRYHPEAFHRRAAVLALHKASLGTHSEALKVLLDEGAPVDVSLPNYPPVLHSAAISCATCVRILLKAGADQNCADYKGRTALHRAAGADKFDCVRVLVAAGAHVDARAADGRRPWMETRSARIVNLMMPYVLSRSFAGSTLSLPQRSQSNRSQTSPRSPTRSLTQSKKQLSSELMGEGAPQNLQRAGSAGPSDTASPGAPSSLDASALPTAGPFGETSTGAASSKGAPACSAAGPSSVTSPGTSTSSNDALANAGAVPIGESPPATSPGTVAEASGVTFQGTSSALSAKFSSKEKSD